MEKLKFLFEFSKVLLTVDEVMEVKFLGKPEPLVNDKFVNELIKVFELNNFLSG